MNATVNTTLNATLKAIVNGTAPVQFSVTPVPTPLPAGMTTTALDWTPIPIAPFNLPLWFIFAILSAGALLIVWLHWNDMSHNLDAVKPWFIKIKELKLGKIQVLRLSRAGNFIPDCLDIFDNVISYGDSEENINQWHLNDPMGIIRIGAVSAPIISEDCDQNRDIPVEIAICHAAEELAANIEDLRIELNRRFKELVDKGVYSPDAENPANIIRPITNGDDYIGQYDEDKAPDYWRSGRYLLQLLNPEGIRIRAFNQFNQNKMRKFWFRGRTSAFYGGENIRKVEDKLVKKSDKELGFFQRYGGLLIAAMIFLACMIGGIAVPI